MKNDIVLINNVSVKRVIVSVEGIMSDNINIKNFILHDYISNEKLTNLSIERDGTQFKVSFNIMALNNERPIETGDWYLIAVDKKEKHYECKIDKKLIPDLMQETYERTNEYNVYYRQTHSQYFCESKVDVDNDTLYFKILYKKKEGLTRPSVLIKTFYRKVMSVIRKWIFIQVFNFFKLFNNPQGNRMLFTSSSRAEIGGNQEFVYRRMKERGIDKKFKISFSYKDNIKSYRSFFTKFSFTRKLAMANIIFVDDFQPEIYLVDFLEYVKVIQLWHACGAFKTIGLERLGKPGSPKFDTDIHKCYTDMTVSSDLSAQHYAEAFGIDERKIVPIGVARTDVFFDQEYKKKIIPEVLKHFPQCKDASEVIMYAPTFRGPNAKNASFPMNMIDYELIGEYLLKTNSVLLIKMHPFVTAPLEIPSKYKNHIIDASQFREINDILFITDIVITDYSSVIYEFSLFNKPMLFYAFDRMKYEADRGFYEPYSDMVPGKIVRTFEQLVKALEDRDFQFEKVEPFVNKNFKYTDGKSTDRIIDNLILNGYSNNDEKEL